MIQPPFEQARSLTEAASVLHGFFGRRCGRSSGDFQGLNASEAGDDDPDLIAENRRLAQVSSGMAGMALASLRQVHGAEVVVLRDPPAPSARPQADAMVTDRPGVALGILTADCCPILFADAEARVIGAAHAGWRGAVAGVVEATVAAMRNLGAAPQRIVAAIGPAISVENYEIGPELAEQLREADPVAERFIVEGKGLRPRFDLPGYVAGQLDALGIGVVERVGGCTYTQFGHYYSHRYATHREEQTGRQISLIGLAVK